MTTEGDNDSTVDDGGSEFITALILAASPELAIAPLDGEADTEEEELPLK